MPIALLRVDERLIHGQVVVGWGERLHIDRIVVVDDQLAASDWEQELYCMGLPASITAEFLGVAEARRSLDGWRQARPNVVVLVRDLDSLVRLAEGSALAGEEVNLGGLHAAPGRRRVLPYLFLSAEDRAGLRAVAEAGARISARDLPLSRAIPVEELLDGA